ncbi:MAG: valine--tRNA ligase, partial [Bdellovibrionales bacterium]|nr:valine--tRNA ligase [Bdellovibrionales bacterium]
PNFDYDPKKDEIQAVSRQNFIEACAVLTVEDEKAFERVWRKLGLSIDWRQTYATIDDHSRWVSQYSFLDLINKGQAYSSVSPTTWDTDFKSAIAQAEIEDRERPGAYHDLEFAVEGGGSFVISTTRPEMLPACIAVVAHPDDERYKDLFGKKAITPLFHAPVPICPAEHADPEKGTGILMICTFGDINDVDWWKQSGLPLRQVLGLDGKFCPVNFGQGAFTSLNAEAANASYQELEGLFVKQAQKKIVEMLAAPDSKVDGSGPALVKEPQPVTHPVKFFEKGDRPLEFIPTRQWFIRVLKHKDELVAEGNKINWYPEYMKTRYQHWVEGLNQDWCISRQRFFGVPFPVWYPIDDKGVVQYEQAIYAPLEALPVDPLNDVPAGYTADQRDQPGGFAGDPDVMDTWATSALTPQICSYWGKDEARHAKLFPSDIRPQGHDIIRTWAFVTIVKAWMHHQEIPWKNILLSGWILDPDRKKMSKSKGNVVTPEHILTQYSADAVRYWAARAKLGVDTAYDESLFRIGAKLTTKLFNASKFVCQQLTSAGICPTAIDVQKISEPLDCALVEKLRHLIAEASKSFERFDYSNALLMTEDAFWNFCDHYLELVKVRSYSEEDSAGKQSALHTLGWSLKTFLRLMAPFVPYVTEEIWSCSFSADKDQHIHTTAWPKTSEVDGVPKPEDATAYDLAVDTISKIRAAKTEAQKSLKWEVAQLIVKANPDQTTAIKPVLSDILRAGNVKEGGVELQASENGFSVSVTLSENWEAA